MTPMHPRHPRRPRRPRRPPYLPSNIFVIEVVGLRDETYTLLATERSAIEDELRLCPFVPHSVTIHAWQRAQAANPQVSAYPIWIKKEAEFWSWGNA